MFVTSAMKLYLTQIQAVDPNDGELKTWAGPPIPADSYEEAVRYAQNNGLGYLVILGPIEEEIPWIEWEFDICWN